MTGRDGDSTDQTSDLARLLFSNQSRDATLQAIAEMAHRNLPECIAASVTVSDNKQMHTAVSSGDLAVFVDERQYEARRGPCLDAIRDRGAVKVDDYELDERWPEVTRSAFEAGVRSSLSLPLMAGDNGVGALNLYGGTLRAFDGYEERAGTFAETAAITVANALAFHRAAELSAQLAEGLESRDVIGQAKGILMARERIDADAAFNRLREMSQHRNHKLRDVAAELVAEANAASTRQ